MKRVACLEKLWFCHRTQLGFVERDRSAAVHTCCSSWTCLWKMDSKKGLRAKRQIVPPSIPGSEAKFMGTTTRSGQSSAPMLDFWRTESGLAEAEDDRCLPGRQNPGKSAPTKSRTRPGHDSVMRDVSNRDKAAATSQERMPGDGFKTAPVLNWWRSQRLTETRAGGLPQDQPSAVKTSDMTGPDPSYSSQALKVVVREPCPDEQQWTKSQLHSLRRAQADTDPSASDFWGVVAERVEGMDPLGCQQKWFEHFATPRGRRQKASKRGPTSGTPLSGNTFLTTATAVHDSPMRTIQPLAPADDLFQTTPMRGRRHFGAQLGVDELGESMTPKTPAGPGAPCEYASRAEETPGDGRTDYQRGVSRTYVQAMSKKMRKGASQLGGGCMAARGKASRLPTPSGGAGRTIHAAAVSRGHKLKISVTSSGAVSVASTHSDEDSVGLSGVESDEE